MTWRLGIEVNEVLRGGEKRAPVVGRHFTEARTDRHDDVDAFLRYSVADAWPPQPNTPRLSGWLSGKTPFAFGVVMTGICSRSASSQDAGGPLPSVHQQPTKSTGRFADSVSAYAVGEMLEESDSNAYCGLTSEKWDDGSARSSRRQVK